MMPGLARMHLAPIQPTIKSEVDEQDDFLLDEEAREDELAYKPRPKLPKPGTFLRTLAYLMKGLDDQIIDVDPEYQREVVWTADRMTGLIDSLMENYYIPPIILNKTTRSSGDGHEIAQALVCVDGKQRLSSVRAFVKGMIPCHDHRGEKWWFCDTPGGKRKKILPEEVQKDFLSKEFISFEYAGLSQEQEEDLFARVQMGVQLSLAEKMRASTGPWQELARCYVDDFPLIYSLLNDRSRAKDFQMTLSCFSQIVEVQHPTASDGIPGLKTNHTHLPKLLKNKGAVDDGIKSHLASVWNTFQELINLDPNTFTNVEKTLRGVQTFAPVEMVAVAVMISTYSESRNNRLLIGDIQALREELRANFVDLRLNAPTWKFVWHFIDNLEQIRGAVDGTTVRRTVTFKPAPTQKAAQAPVSTGAKRGRPPKRANLPIELPRSSNFVSIKTEEATSPSTNPHLTKRQRVDSGSASIYSRPKSILETVAAPTGSFHPLTRLGRPSTSDSMGLDALSKPGSFVPWIRSDLLSTASLSSTAVLAQSAMPPSPPIVRAPTVAESAYQPAHVQKAREAQLSKTERQPMAPPSQPGRSGSRATPPIRSPITPPVVDENIWGARSSSALPASPSTQTPSTRRFVTSDPIRSPSHLQETLHPEPSGHSRARPPQARPTPQPRAKEQSRSFSQYDGAIDLTDDVEQERVDLLLSFRASHSAKHQAPSAAKNSAMASHVNARHKSPLKSPHMPRPRDPIVIED